MIGKIVIRRALLLGGIAFAAGFVGPIVFRPTSNLGPMLGILLTGPMGTIVGALWGIAMAARESDAAQTRELLAWLSGSWMATLLYTLFAATLSARFTAMTAGLQLVVLFATAWILYGTEIRSRLPEPVRRCLPVILALMTFILAATVFPPVMRPWWGLDQQTASSADLPPRLAFVLDARLDASRHVPLLTIQKSALILEWIAAAALAVVICIVITKARPAIPKEAEG